MELTFEELKEIYDKGYDDGYDKGWREGNLTAHRLLRREAEVNAEESAERVLEPTSRPPKVKKPYLYAWPGIHLPTSRFASLVKEMEMA